MKKELLAISLLGCLTACGGGGGSSDSTSSETNNTSNTDQTSTDTTTNNVATDANIATIAGVYNTSRDSDESYLYISDTGMVTSYDYQGDTAGSGDNCYQKVTGISNINGDFVNVTFSESTNKYTLEGLDNTVTFAYDETNGMNDFTTNGFLSSGTGVNIQASNMNIKLGGEGSKQSTTVQISDIEGSICN